MLNPFDMHTGVSWQVGGIATQVQNHDVITISASYYKTTVIYISKIFGLEELDYKTPS